MIQPVFSLLFLGFSLAAADDTAEFRARREALRKAAPGALVYVPGGTEEEKGNIRSGFVQDPNFYYLTGWMEPGAAALIGPGVDVLLLPEPNPTRERYTGKKDHAGTPGIAARTGFEKVANVNALKELLAAQGDARLLSVRMPAPEALKEAAGNREVTSALETIHRLRMVKSAKEVELIQHTTDVTIEAHKAAWRRTAPGLREYQIAATMSNVYFEAGCERHGYPPIVASGPNAIILHYQSNKRKMDSGELLLMDVGAECAMYTADITRTIPVNGKFTARQRELYNAVLKAADAAIAAAKPGVTFASLNELARKTLREAGTAKGGKTLDNYLTYFLGHGVGLEVHDPTDRPGALQPGMIVTIEPGVYIPEEGIGIRIEDMIVITETGARNMTEALPRTAEAIEKFMARGKSAR